MCEDATQALHELRGTQAAQHRVRGTLTLLRHISVPACADECPAAAQGADTQYCRPLGDSDAAGSWAAGWRSRRPWSSGFSQTSGRTMSAAACTAANAGVPWENRLVHVQMYAAP